MQRITLLFTLFALLLFSAEMAQSQDSPASSLPIDLYDNYLIVVRGSVGGLAKLRFIIDTGAYPTVISPPIAKKLRLSGNKEEVRMVGHNMDSYVTYLPVLQLGPLKSENLRVVVKDLSIFERHIGAQIDGMVGLDVLKQRGFRIDYRERKIIFGAPESLPFSAPILWDFNKACINVDVNGRSMPLLLDSGAADIMLFEQKFSELAKESGYAWTSANLGGIFHVRQIRLKSLSTAGSDLGAREVFLSDTDNMSSFIFAGVMALGPERFRQVEFDFEHETFSWEPAKWKERSMPVARAAVGTNGPPTASSAAGETQSITTQECVTDLSGESTRGCSSPTTLIRQER